MGAGKMRGLQTFLPKKQRVDTGEEIPSGVILEPVGRGESGCFWVKGETLDDIENRRDPAVRYPRLNLWDEVDGED